MPFANPGADVAGESWNRMINFGFARSTKASMARRSRLTPQTKVMGGLSSSSPSSNVAPYISSAVVVGADKWSSESPGPSMLCAGFRRSCKVGGGSTMVVG